MLLEKQFGVFTFAILGQAHRPCPIYLVTLLSLSLYFALLCKEFICLLASIQGCGFASVWFLALLSCPRIEADANCKWPSLLGRTSTLGIRYLHSGSMFLA